MLFFGNASVINSQTFKNYPLFKLIQINHCVYLNSFNCMFMLIQVPDHLEPGLDDKQMTRLLGLALNEDEEEIISNQQKPSKKTSILDIPPEEMAQRLDQQAKTNSWHKFVDGNLILKQGLVDKRKVKTLSS